MTKKSWRDVLPIHPAANIFPRMSADELVALSDDIKKNGLTASLALWEDSKGERYLLDGRNRLDAMEAVGLPVLNAEGDWLDQDVDASCVQLSGDKGDDPYAYVTSLNLHRRNLTTEQKREVIANLLKAQPEKSDRQIAEQAKVSPTTVGKVRSIQLSTPGQLPPKRVGKDGKSRKQPAKTATAAKQVAAEKKPQAAAAKSVTKKTIAEKTTAGETVTADEIERPTEPNPLGPAGDGDVAHWRRLAEAAAARERVLEERLAAAAELETEVDTLRAENRRLRARVAELEAAADADALDIPDYLRRRQ
jgi:hypothetical protein